MTAGRTVEYYLVTDSTDGARSGGDRGYLRVEWSGADPSFVMVAPLHEALEELGAFAADAEAAWPAPAGDPYFYIEPGSIEEYLEAFSSTNWSDYLTPGRIRDTLGVTDAHAAEMVGLAAREAQRLTELLHAARAQGCGLLAVVF